MSEITLSSNLEYLMNLHGGLSISELARQTKIPQPTLHHIINRTTKKPRLAALQALADFFSVSVAQLTGALPLHSHIPNSLKESLEIRSIPIIEWEAVREWIKVKSRSAINAERSIIVNGHMDSEVFALIMSDASMEPIFSEGSLLIFVCCEQVKDRSFVLVRQGDRILFNRIFIDNEEVFIKQKKSINESEFIKLNMKNDKIIARLVEVRTQF